MMTIANLDVAREDIRLSSAGGAPFLICFGVTIAVCGLLAFQLSRETAALLVMFQGGVALPAAFGLERLLGRKTMDPANPLKSLSIQLAMSQIVAFPIVIAMYSLNPGGVPLAMASIAGGHFLPYAWLHRTSIYVWLGVAVSFGALGIQIVLGGAAFPWVLLWMSACYAAAVPALLKHART